MNERPSNNLGIEDAVQLIVTMINNGDLDQAVTLAGQLHAAAPDHLDVLYVCAGLYWKIGERNQAIALQQRLVAAQPANAGHHERCIYFLRETGDVSGALAAAQTAVRECPSNPTLINALGILQLNIGDLQGSRKPLRAPSRPFLTISTHIRI